MNETYHNYSLSVSRDTDYIFKVMGSKMKVRLQYFLENSLFRRRHTERQFAVEDDLLFTALISKGKLIYIEKLLACGNVVIN